MNIIITDKENHLKLAQIEVSKSDYKDEYEKEIKKNIRAANIPGFRPGNAPRKMIEGRVGKRIEFDLIFKLAQEELQKKIEAEKWDLLVRPLFADEEKLDDKWLSEENKTLNINFCLKPEIRIDFSKVKAPVNYQITFEEKDLDTFLQEEAKKYPLSEEDDTIRSEDYFVKIKKVSDSDEEAKDQMVRLNYIENKKIVDLFLEKKVGDVVMVSFDKKDEKDFNSFSPEELEDKKEVAFEILGINKMTPREIDLEFINATYGISAKTLEDSKAKALSITNQQHKSESERYFVDEVLDVTKKTHRVDLPIDFLLKSYEQNSENKIEDGASVRKYISDIHTKTLIENTLTKELEIDLGEAALRENIKEHLKKYYAARGVFDGLNEAETESQIEGMVQHIFSDEKYLDQHFSRMYREKVYVELIKKLKPKDKKTTSKDFFDMLRKSYEKENK